MFVPAFLFFRERSKWPVADEKPVSASAPLEGHTLPETLRDRNFWQFAASVALFIGPSMIIGRIVMGVMFDRLNARVVSAIAFLLPACGCIMLGLMDGSYAMAAATGIIIGLGYGAEMDVVAYVTSRYFGMRSYGTIFALISGLYGMGIGAGSAISGLLFDATSSYKIALILWTISSLCATAMVVSLGRPRLRGHASVPHPAHPAH